ncbi:MAG: hypothetical protein Q9214_003496 [Letrouitia sp. 1 TL-2023]
MRTSACKAVKSVSFTSARPRCRIVASRRLPQQRRAFQSTPRHLRQDDPPEVPDAARHSITDEKSPQPVATGNGQEAEDGVNSSSDGTPRSGRPVDRNNYGSASKRAGRNVKKPKEIPPVYLPQRFLDHNVLLREELRATLTSGQETFSIDRQETLLGREVKGDSSNNTGPKDPNAGSRAAAEEHYVPAGSTNVHIMQEIYSLVAAGLRPTSVQYPDPSLSAKPHLVLHCPRNGGMFFLDTMVQHLAAMNSADIIQIEAQDIAEIGGNYLDGLGVDLDHLSSLGYDIYMPGARESRTPGETPEEDEYGEEVEEEDDDESNRRPKVLSIRSGLSVIPLGNIGNIANNLAEMAKTNFGPHSTPQNPSSMVKVLGIPAKDSTKELKVTALIETLLHASDAKRALQLTDLPNTEVHDSVNGSSDEEANDCQPDSGISKLSNTNLEPALILQIKDYLEMTNTSNGSKLLDALHEAVKQRRKDGQKILIVGTSAYESTKPQSTKSGFKSSQSDLDTGPTRTVVTPVIESTKVNSNTLKHYHGKRLVAINGRNLQDMVRRLSSDSAQIEKFTSLIELDLDSANVFVSDMADRVLPSERVHRIATVALGLLESNEEFSTKHLERAIDIIESSDNAKYAWFEMQENKAGHQPSERMRKLYERNRATKPKKDVEDRLQRLRKTCNPYERKLLNGVIDPGSIRTTFADVCALPETIDALKTLTSLSLVRPDAFTYGVLATDRIPGLLLYGPPGTGKTLLAKAVAKESGATVLEVSGSDIYDKYVGEGEKNVKAVFSLAKKLTPCIVFIDEADAILGSRGGSANRSSHRELINQFLREWDGMSETSAFIMVATNRPFDLDEASLRRLPRRMLIDLPTEKDREAILGIHLKGEHLDPNISLAKLASETPFYSGSDLKNLAVAAALACVREEYETAVSLQAQTESSPSIPPISEAQPLVTDPPSSSSESNLGAASSSETVSTTSNTAHNILSATNNSLPTSQPGTESATAAHKSPPPPSSKYPRRRTLRPHHFAKALQEISASISDDMRSLTAIRKFDEKYGDRKGRRKKLGGGYGFATVGEEERERVEGEGARIRKER